MSIEKIELELLASINESPRRVTLFNDEARALLDELSRLREENRKLAAEAHSYLSQLLQPEDYRLSEREGKAVAVFAEAILHGDDEHRAWLTEAADAFIAGQPLPPPRGKGTGPAPQAVPAEDVAKIETALLKLSKVGLGYDLNPHDKWALKQAATALTSISAERDRQREYIRKQAEDIMTLGRLVYPKDGIGSDDTWKARCAASEAEATSLRRKLEEHRETLAEARERINRYADTAAEHDLVARIDALEDKP